MQIQRTIAVLLTGILWASISQGRLNNYRSDDLQTVPYVDVKKYMGKWYEIASIPQWFSINCVGSTADYALRRDGLVQVYNSCWKGDFEGPRNSAGGKARVVDLITHAKLKVKFNRVPFEGDYWVLELGDNYDYAVVGDPGRFSAFVLSRTPTMDETLYQELLIRLEEKHGYDASRLKRTTQRSIDAGH
jgi:apolipoprotein D and lipocalin family protein